MSSLWWFWCRRRWSSFLRWITILYLYNSIENTSFSLYFHSLLFSGTGAESRAEGSVCQRSHLLRWKNLHFGHLLDDEHFDDGHLSLGGHLLSWRRTSIFLEMEESSWVSEKIFITWAERTWHFWRWTSNFWSTSTFLMMDIYFFWWWKSTFLTNIFRFWQWTCTFLMMEIYFFWQWTSTFLMIEIYFFDDGHPFSGWRRAAGFFDNESDILKKGLLVLLDH